MKELLLEEKKRIERLLELNVPNDQQDAENALQQSLPVYCATLEKLASDKALNEANIARSAEINRILKERDQILADNEKKFCAQLELIERLLGQLL